MNKSVTKKVESPFKSEVSPAMVAILAVVLVVLFGGYFAFQRMRGPKILTGNSGATMSNGGKEQHSHIDEFTGNQVNRD